MVKRERSNGFSSIIILSAETIEKNVRRKSRHCLLPHTYAPRESHKSHGALKLRNLPIKGRESVGCPSSRGDYAKLHWYGIISRGRASAACPSYVYVCRSAHIQIASESLPIGWRHSCRESSRSRADGDVPDRVFWLTTRFQEKSRRWNRSNPNWRAITQYFIKY